MASSSSSQTKLRDGFSHPYVVIDDPSYKPVSEMSATATMMEAINNSRSPMTPIASNRHAASASSSTRQSTGRFRQHRQQIQDNNFVPMPKTCPACAYPLIYHEVSNPASAGIHVPRTHTEGIHLIDSVTTDGTAQGGGWSFDETHGTPDPMPLYNDSAASYTAPPPPPISDECSIVMPLESLLDAVIETYCETLQEQNHEEDNTQEMMRRKRRKSQREQQQQEEQTAVVDGSINMVMWQRDPLRMVPPYCPNCKTYIVLESFLNNYYQEEHLSNLATWLAQSFSQDSAAQDEQTPARPSHGSILVVLDNKAASINHQRTPSHVSQQNSAASQAPTPFSTNTSSTEQKRRSAIDFFTKLKDQAIQATSESSKPKSPPRWDEDWDDTSPKAGSVSNLRGSLSPGASSHGSLSHESNKWSKMILQSVKPPQKSSRPKPQQDPPERLESRQDESRERYIPTGRGTSWEDTSSERYNRDRRDDEDDETLVYSVSNEDHKVFKRQSASQKQGTINLRQTAPHEELDLQQVSTLEEERLIVGDYAMTRGIATRAIGKKLMEGFLLTSIQCKDCHMPLMARDGKAGCVVCPFVTRKAKKRAQKLREAIQTAWAASPRSDNSNLPEFEVLETVSIKPLYDPFRTHPTHEPTSPFPQRHFNAAVGTSNKSPEASSVAHSNTSKSGGGQKAHSVADNSRQKSPVHMKEGSPLSSKAVHLPSSQRQPRQLQSNQPQSGTIQPERTRQNPPGASPRNMESPKRSIIAKERQLSPTKEIKSDGLLTPIQSPVRGAALQQSNAGDQNVFDNCPHSASASPLTTFSSLPSVTNSSLTTYKRHEGDVSTRHKIRKAATNEVFRRLQNGWQMTSSQCPSCRAPLMQSPTDEIDCVFCQATDALSPKSVASPRQSKKDELSPRATNESHSLSHQKNNAENQLRRSPPKSIQRSRSPQSPPSSFVNAMSPIQSSPSSRDSSPQKRPPTSPSKRGTSNVSTPRSSSSSNEQKGIPKHIVAHQRGDGGSVTSTVASLPNSHQPNLSAPRSQNEAQISDSQSSKGPKQNNSVVAQHENAQETAVRDIVEKGSVGGGGGVLYLAIPEGLDLDDDKAVLNLLSELRKNTTAAAATVSSGSLVESGPQASVVFDHSSAESDQNCEVRKWSEVVALSLLESQQSSPPAQEKVSDETGSRMSRSQINTVQILRDLPHSLTWNGPSLFTQGHNNLPESSCQGIDFQKSETWHDEHERLYQSHEALPERLATRKAAANREVRLPLGVMREKMDEDASPPEIPDLGFGHSGTLSVRTGYSGQDSVLDIVGEFAKELQTLALEDQSVTDDLEEGCTADACPFCLQKLDGSRDNTFCGNRKCKFFMVPRDVMEFFSPSSEDFVHDDGVGTSQTSYGSPTSRLSNTDFLLSQLQPEATSVSGSTVSLLSSHLQLRFADASDYGSPQSSQRRSSEWPYYGSRNMATRSLASSISPDPSDPLSPSRISYRSSQRMDQIGATSWNETLVNRKGPVNTSRVGLPYGGSQGDGSRTVHELVDRLAMAAKALKSLEHSVSRAENSSTASSSVLSAASSIRSVNLGSCKYSD